MKHLGHHLSANISIMFTEHPYLRRFASARDAGFEIVETWWPFSGPTPSDGEVTAWIDAALSADVQVDAINFYAGDMAAGERGVCALPGRHAELSASLPTLRRLAEATNCQKFNLLYGQPDQSDHPRHAALAYREAAREVASFGGSVLIEPLAAGLNGTYPLLTHDDVESFVDTHLPDVKNIGLLLDTFHLGSNSVDPATAFASSVPVRHVQIADTPGRGEPGTGNLRWPDFFEALTTSSYHGVVGCEYRPVTTTEASVGWIRA